MLAAMTVSSLAGLFLLLLGHRQAMT